MDLLVVRSRDQLYTLPPYGSELRDTGSGSVCGSVSGSVSGSVFDAPSLELNLVRHRLWIRLRISSGVGVGKLPA